MTQALGLKGHESVLEIGTGSGYQAAILSQICAKVYTVERIDSLLVKARKIFDSLHYLNILTKLDDGTNGWLEYAPYDAIIVTAGGPKVPEPLLEQLTDPGVLVIPVGDRGVQDLRRVTKKEGKITEKTIEFVRFVSLIGDHGWERD
jgi:protein-L-isoaspartate(D-aspartate) O-methyltransferase